MKLVSMSKWFLAIVFMMILTSSSFFSPLVQSSTDYCETYNTTTHHSFYQRNEEWNDGTFTGTWNSSKTNQQGNLQGFLNFGRTNQKGSLHGFLKNDNKELIGEFNGYFSCHVLLGFLQLPIESKTSFFIGNITYNNDCFSAQIFLPFAEQIQIQGTFDASFLPPLTGSFDIGVQQYHLVDTDRMEYFTENLEDHREMMIQLWYPIEKDASGENADYMDPTTFRWLKDQSPISLVSIPNDAYQFICPHLKNNTSIAPSSSPFPVIIFSHGYDGVYQIYTSFIEDLVSHGFVVASINHPYVAGITVFPDGRTIPIASVPDEKVEDFFSMSLRSVIEDAKFVLDYLTLLNSSENQWQGTLDLSKVGMFGHSFGGAATAVCCMEDSRFKAGLILDGVFYPDFLNDDIFSPMLLMFTRSRYQSDDGADFLWNRLTYDAYKLGINGSAHYSYTDVGLLLQHLTPLLPPDLLGFGSISPKRMVNMSRQIELAFFDTYLRNGDQHKLTMLFELYDEVMVTKK